MTALRKRMRVPKRTPKKLTVADLLRARMERERKLYAKSPTPVLTEKLTPITGAATKLGVSVWTLRHKACAGELNYRRIGRRIFVTDTEIARLAGSEFRAVNAA